MGSINVFEICEAKHSEIHEVIQIIADAYDWGQIFADLPSETRLQVLRETFTMWLTLPDVLTFIIKEKITG